jgi:hypothetical protein
MLSVARPSLQARHVGGVVLAHHADDARIAAQHFQVVGDVGAQPPNSVRMVGARKDTFTLCSWSASRMLSKRLELHDGVDRDRAADQRSLVMIVSLWVEDGDVIAGCFQLVSSKYSLTACSVCGAKPC